MRYLPALLLLSAGCMQVPGVHPTLHPAAPGSGKNAGVALGAMVQTGNDQTNANIGYGEGWVRLGPTGAFEVRTTPQAAFLAYDIPVSEGETSVSLRPSFGLSILRFVEDQGAMGDDSSMVALLHPGASLVINSGSFYVAPRLGLAQSAVIEGDGDGDNAYSVAATIGTRIPGGFSFELTGALSDGFDDTDEAIWTIVPSLGISIGN